MDLVPRRVSQMDAPRPTADGLRAPVSCTCPVLASDLHASSWSCISHVPTTGRGKSQDDLATSSQRPKMGSHSPFPVPGHCALFPVPGVPVMFPPSAAEDFIRAARIASSNWMPASAGISSSRSWEWCPRNTAFDTLTKEKQTSAGPPVHPSTLRA